MLSGSVDNLLARLAARRASSAAGGRLATRFVQTPVGPVRLYDSASSGACVVMVPDGPNVIEHHEHLIRLLSARLRVVCFDMPGFGFSLPDKSYAHSLDDGAAAVVGVLDALGIERATLAFSCANGFYAMRVAQQAPARVTGLVLAQTPSLAAMRTWTRRVIPRPLRMPVIGQVTAWLTRRKAARGWYRAALPRATDATPYQDIALRALDHGACFCLAGVVQGLARAGLGDLDGLSLPCTMIWGPQDRSHRYTDPESLRTCVPGANVVSFDGCGHFPELEAPDRYADILLRHVAEHASFGRRS